MPLVHMRRPVRPHVGADFSSSVIQTSQPIVGRLDRITNAQKPEETAPGERTMKRLMIDLVQLSCMFAIVMGMVVVAASLLI
jgi:hypothetical protein